jgi:hypothetical protein
MFARILTLSIITSGLVLSSLAMSSSKVFADSEKNVSAAASSATTISDRDVEQLGQNWGGERKKVWGRRVGLACMLQ